ncbi:MAG: polysaccharide biosynthesis protein [Anaerolineae bacterium]|nr:polysaccharide biosynthesis protein [Anaerolineae bacterium]NUQ06414.1 polysaccharide biosynthesis protein [Anaerolineae bacterium]
MPARPVSARAKPLARRWIGVIGDVFLVTLAYSAALALLAYGDAGYAQFALQGHFLVYLLAAQVLLPGVLAVFGVYRQVWERASVYGSALLGRAVLVATAIYIICALIVPGVPPPFRLILLGNLFTLLGFSVVRYRGRLLSELSRRAGAAEAARLDVPIRLLIVGAGESGQALAWRIRRLPEEASTRCEVIGFIDDDPKKLGLMLEGSRVLGARADIVEIVKTLHVDVIVIAIHRIAGAEFRAILAQCEQSDAQIRVALDLPDLFTTRRVQDFWRDVDIDDLVGRASSPPRRAADLEPLRGKRVLITGAAGVIGSELSRQVLVLNPTALVLLDHHESALYHLAVALRMAHPEVTISAEVADVTRRGAVRAIFEAHRPQIVFHAAAQKDLPVVRHHPQEAVYGVHFKLVQNDIG